MTCINQTSVLKTLAILTAFAASASTFAAAGNDLPPIGSPSYPMPSNPSEDASLASWCDQVVLILRQGRADALALAYSDQDAAALVTIERAMSQAMTAGQAWGPSRSLTGRTLARGLSLIQELRRDFATGGSVERHSLLNLADRWLGLAIEVGETMDPRFPTPWNGCGHYCGGHDLNSLHTTLVALSQRQLRLVSEELANGYFPLGSSRFFLRAAQRVMHAVANQDLATGMFAPQHACIVLDLRRAIAEIQIGFSNSYRHPELVRLAVDVINRSVDSLNQSGCGH